MATISRKGVYERNKRPEKLSGAPEGEVKYEDKYQDRQNKMVYRDMNLHPRHEKIMRSIAKTAAIWEK